MEWLIASLAALLDEASGKPTGAFRDFLDDRAVGLATMLSETRRDVARATDEAAAAMVADAELVERLVEEIEALNREIVELTARNLVHLETQRRLEAQHRGDRAHIRELIAEMVRRDIR